MNISCFVVIIFNIAKYMWTELLTVMLSISVVSTVFCAHAEDMKE